MRQFFYRVPVFAQHATGGVVVHPHPAAAKMGTWHAAAGPAVGRVRHAPLCIPMAKPATEGAGMYVAVAPAAAPRPAPLLRRPKNNGSSGAVVTRVILYEPCGDCAFWRARGELNHSADVLVRHALAKLRRHPLEVAVGQLPVLSGPSTEALDVRPWLA